MSFSTSNFTSLLLLLMVSTIAVTDSTNSQQQQTKHFLTPPLFPTESFISSTQTPKKGRYECSPTNKDGHESIPHMRGTSLGGWLVLEPWITPSLFYQFLGVSEKLHGINNATSIVDRVAIDSLTFCKALGAKEANRQLRLHWKSWVTEDSIRSLAEKNITHIRIPVPDWIYVPYGPFRECFDGALEALDHGLHWAEKHGLKVLLDLHAARGSQVENNNNT